MNNTSEIQGNGQSVSIQMNSQISPLQNQHAISQGLTPIQGLGQQVFQNINSSDNTVINLQGGIIYLAHQLPQPDFTAPRPPHRVTIKPIQNLEENLQKWVVNGGDESNLENRRKVVMEIKKDNQYLFVKAGLELTELNLTTLPSEIGFLITLQFLSLENNELTTLPKEIGELRLLECLILNYNKIHTLPSEIGFLASLWKLELNNNELMTLSSEIGSLGSLRNLELDNNKLELLPREISGLVALEELSLVNNKLVTLPSGIGSLRSLRILNLNGNNLQFLPSEMGLLPRLSILYINDNPNLNDLPMSLGQMSSLTCIHHNNPKLNSVVNAIQEQNKAVRTGEALLIMSKRLVTWANIGKISADLPNEIVELSDDQKKNLNEWLLRLETTKDFSRHQESLAKTVCDMILDVVKNKEFRDLFFTQVVANNECCEDRAAMALNEIHSSWEIICLSPEASIKEKLYILRGVANAQALRKAIASRIDLQQKKYSGNIENESVEIYLYYENALKDRLHLRSPIKGMSYRDLGKRDWIDEEELINEVERSYFDSLFDIPVFMKILEMDQPNIAKEFKKINDIYMVEIRDPLKGEQLSPAVLHWNAKVRGVNEELKAMKLAFALEWYLEKV